MTRKIVRLPKEWSDWGKLSEITNWLFANKCHSQSEILYKHVPWEDGKWHTGPHDVMYAIDFDDPDDAMQFAIWIGLGID